MNTRSAFSYCEKLARSHYENFPVGSWLIPPRKRPYVWAVYAFARTADDFADEGRHPHEIQTELDARLRKLQEWEDKLRQAELGQAHHPIFVAVAQTLKDCNIPTQLLVDLLRAYRMDVTKRRYSNWEEVLYYCQHSANPVGRLVLHIFGYHDEEIQTYSDAICTALQLTNFWQDIAVDWEKDRLYIPQDILASYGLCEDDIAAQRINKNFRNMMLALKNKTAQLFNQGLPLLAQVSGDLRLEMRMTWLGGTAILEKTQACGFDVYRHRPTINLLNKIALLGRALMPGTIAPLKILPTEKAFR